ncbi:MAG: FecR domain-containing protein [Planctomycetes bacterium]|nr:FecR domain-containing protein [Planctomycetota bacterium]
MKLVHALLLALLLSLPSIANAQEGETPEGSGEAATEGTTEFYAVVKKIDGDADEVEVELPDGEAGDVALDAKYPAGTTIVTGEATVILSLSGMVNGQEVNNAMISIRPVTELLLDQLVIASDSAATRIQIKSGDIRVKITNDREDLSTDMKVSTPNATASVTGTEVNQIGFSPNFGTTIAVASGSISAANNNGTSTNVGGGTALAAGSDSTLDSALAAATTNVAPIGMTSYEVSVSQLSIAGPNRAGSDNNNAATNPTANRNTGSGSGGRVDDGQPLPSMGGRLNRR